MDFATCEVSEIVSSIITDFKPIIHARIPSGIFPLVSDKTFCALKNIPDPITIPITIEIAVANPYFFVSSFSISKFLHKNFVYTTVYVLN